MLALCGEKRLGRVRGLESSQVADVFNGLLADPVQLAVYMLIIVGVGVGVTRAGVQKGVERVTKVMMMALFVVLVALCVRAVTLLGARRGPAFLFDARFQQDARRRHAGRAAGNLRRCRMRPWAKPSSPFR